MTTHTVINLPDQPLSPTDIPEPDTSQAEPPTGSPTAPRTALDAATLLLADFHHVHYVSDGTTRCLNERCATADQLLAGLA